jgi:NAD(P)-dependent dehydrogenase (short-subunit alcohol dehydrogenase family)
LTQRSVLVTGASRGIGLAIAERFRAGGFRVIAPTRSEMNLSSAESVKQYLEHDGGREEIDVLVNNAGENKIESIARLALADFERILTTNLTSALLLTQHYAPKMAARGWGRIVNISSCYSFLARPGRVAYSASKGALNAITRTAALEFGPENVLVNAVAPGFVETEMTKKNNPPSQIAQLASQTALGRLAQPEEIAELVFFLASAQNTYITGQVVVVDGGFSCQ